MTKIVYIFFYFKLNFNFSRPTALAWWKGSSFAAQIGIIGTEQGEIIFINLESGLKIGSTKIEGCVTNLGIYQDKQLDTVTLLITNDNKNQWQLILEKPSTKYIYPLYNQATENEDNEDSKNFPTTRSRLRGLKQLSVEKLVILKQKLAETRNRNLDMNILQPGRIKNGNAFNLAIQKS